MTISITCQKCRRTKSAKVDRLPADLETVLTVLEYRKTEGGFLCAECGSVKGAREDRATA